jgi:hypothetical protein
MGIYMPECDGIELASVIRQDDTYANSSIVFLSSEIDSEIQLKAIDIGVDDFVSKPIEPNQLISVVASRVKRTRGLNNIRTELQSSLRNIEFQRIALDSHSIVSIADASGNISYVNNKFCEVSGYSRKELIGRNHRIVKSGEHAKEFYDDMWKTISSGKVWSGEIKNRKKNGGFYWVESTIVPFLDAKDIPYQYISIRTDITPIMKIQEDLFDAKERAESASRAKTEFLSNMSHELRTPLNAILGFSQILLQDELSDTHRESLGEIQNAGNHLLHLINEVLDLATIESDRLTISMEPVVLHGVLTECVSLIAPLAERKSIQVDFSAQQNIDCLVHADNLRLKQVIINLLSNAIKYNHENGHIKLYCKRNNNALRVYVEDDGIGMTESEVSELFKPFHRLVEHSYGAEGTGIGLFISKKLLELMGGKIGVKSEKGKGTVFWVELGLGAVPEEEVQEESGMIDSKLIQETQKKYTVLYVEDNPVNMLLIDKIVKRTSDFELLKAFTPEEGIELARNNKIDLFLLDINLPGMTGFELLQHFRAQQATKNVKAVALSANAMETDIQHGINSGFIDYITKPIVVEQFIDKLRAILECE